MTARSVGTTTPGSAVDLPPPYRAGRRRVRAPAPCALAPANRPPRLVAGGLPVRKDREMSASPESPTPRGQVVGSIAEIHRGGHDRVRLRRERVGAGSAPPRPAGRRRRGHPDD